MKLIIRSLLFLVAINIGCLNSYAQCGNYSGNINDLPVCGQYGDASGNSNWDWESTDKNNPSFCSMWYARINGSNIPMSSPFVDASLITLDVISQQQDFTRAKGWELLRRDFGCVASTTYPYFVLYNKYSGLLRMFIYSPAGQTSYSGIAVELAPNVNSTYPATTAFSDTIQTAPDKYLGSNQSSNFGKGIVAIGQLGGSSQWSLVEFNPSFDPNIQNAIYTGAALQFTVYGVTTNNMFASIRGGSVVSTQPIYNFTYKPVQAKAPLPDGQFDFKGVGEKFIKFSQGITGIRTEINNTATSIATFLNGTNDSLLNKVRNVFVALQTFSSTTGDFEKTFGKISEAIKGAGSFFKVVGAVIGLFSGSSGTPAAMPAYTNYDLVLQGTVTTKVILSTLTLRVPGTNQNDNNNATYYKCPLGIFNIKNTPEADVVTYNRTDRYRRLDDPVSPNYPIQTEYVSYKIRNNLTVSFNSGAGLELVSAQAAIVGEVLPKTDGTASYDLFEKHDAYNIFLTGYHRVRNHMRTDLESGRLEIKYFDKVKKLHIFQTPYTNIECLNGLAFNAVATTKVYLQVKAVLKKTNDPANTPIMYIQNYAIDTYPATISDDMKNKYKWYPTEYLPPYANHTELPLYESDIHLSNYTYTSIHTEKADNTLTTNNTITISPSTQVTFAAGGTINLNPGFEAKSGCDFSAKINDYGYSLNCISPQAEAFVFPGNCYNTSITALGTNTTEATIEPDVAISKLNVYPTLSNGNVNITGDEIQQARIVIVDQSGRIVYQYDNKSNKTSIQLNLHHLTNGMYFIKIDSPGKTVTKKLLISK